MRSPRIAPPVKGEEGSTATIPTVLPRRRYAWARRCARVDLPAPGGPVMPKTRARPVRGKRGHRIPGAPPFLSTALIARPMARACPARTPSTIDRKPSAVSRERRLLTANGSRLTAHGSRRQEALGDDQFLDFGGPLADGAQFDVAVELLDGKVLDEAVAAVDLERTVGHADRHLGGVVLRLGRETPVVLSPVLGLRRAPRAIPTESAAIEIRPASRIFIEFVNPSPSVPRRFSSGIQQSSITSVQVSDARMPSLFSFLPTRMPGLSSSTMKEEIPPCPLAGSVTAIRTATPPTDALVMKFFEPFKTQPARSRTAVDLVPPESEPASASVRPHAASQSPEVSRGM